MKVAVMWFPGTNCQEETARAVNAAGMEAEIVRWNEDVSGYDGYVLPGGWSYEDRVRAGVMAAKDSVMENIVEEASTGKPVLGICNGAQILVEAGLIPGLEEGVEMALAPNDTGYWCVWTHLKVTSEKGRSAYNDFYEERKVIEAPIAHGEGRFVTNDGDLLKELEEKDQIIFRYCDRKGNVTEEANPNGAVDNIAGICNDEGNVLALMPHPERAAWFKNIPYFEQHNHSDNETNTSSNLVFESMRRYIDGS